MSGAAVVEIARVVNGAELVDVVVVGAGPWAFMAAVELTERIGIERVVVVDRAPWLSECSEWIDRLEAGLVGGRSLLADALRVATRLPQLAHGGVPLDARAALDRCAHRVAELGLDRCWRAGRLAWLVPVDGGKSTLVQLADGTQLHSRRVVLAPGTQFREIPHWVEDLVPQPVDRLVHTDDLDLRHLDLRDERVAVVGVADVSMHLAVRALSHGADRVEVITPARLRQDDQVADQGSGGRLRIRADARVIAAGRSAGSSELVLGDEERIEVDRVWLATGTTTDLRGDRTLRFLREFLPTHPTACAALDDELRWPGSGVHLLGPASSVLAPPGAVVPRGRLGMAQLIARSIEAALAPCGSPATT